MTRLLIICAITFVAATAAAEPVVHTQPTFPLRIMQIHAAGTGAYLMASKNEIWFVEGTGVARQVPIPLEGQIQSLAFEPHSGLLWGCTRESVFATDAAGAWQSWGLGDASTRQRCYVAPSPGTTWVFGNAADDQGSYVEFGMVGGAELTLSLDRIRGAHLDKLASDQAGGVWATVQYPQPGLIHFDGGSWRVSSTDPQQWLGTEFTDVFGLDRAIYAEILASNGVGGLAAVSTAEFVFVRSTAP